MEEERRRKRQRSISQRRRGMEGDRQDTNIRIGMEGGRYQNVKKRGKRQTPKQ